MKLISLAVPVAYPAASAPNISFDFEPKKVTFVFTSVTAGHTAEISVDGTEDAVRLSVDGQFKQYESVQRAKKYWVKGAGGATLLAIAES